MDLSPSSPDPRRPGTGPFFGLLAFHSQETVVRKYGPVPFFPAARESANITDMVGESFQLADRAGAAEAIRRMNEEDLRFLNRLIVERLKLIAQARSTAMLAHFNMGDRVSFQSNSGEQKTGVIVRLNTKTASIATDDGQQWKVHPVYLRPAGPSAVESPERRPA